MRKILLFHKSPLFTSMALKDTCSCLLWSYALGNFFLESPISQLHANIAGEKNKEKGLGATTNWSPRETKL